ncbi:hypothetical protein TNCV_1609391 [Trichonephila clavipes]|nr:hypothetical protein TNCV_1609391 [Trichonephila clavipes]
MTAPSSSFISTPLAHADNQGEGHPKVATSQLSGLLENRDLQELTLWVGQIVRPPSFSRDLFKAFFLSLAHFLICLET